MRSKVWSWVVLNRQCSFGNSEIWSGIRLYLIGLVVCSVVLVEIVEFVVFVETVGAVVSVETVGFVDVCLEKQYHLLLSLDYCYGMVVFVLLLVGVVLLMEHHNLQLVVRRTFLIACRIQELLGTVEDEGILLGKPNIFRMIFLEAHWHLDRPYRGDVFGSQLHFVANHRHEFLRYREAPQCRTVLLQYRSSKSSIVYRRFRGQI